MLAVVVIAVMVVMAAVLVGLCYAPNVGYLF
jgi:hypothetical protein